ncbi:MAG TPA: metallophosphoesterase [Thermoguttaceae bacterium]|nr:metallophosphoesterase [Thermoguttaceae bacterium]
MDYWAHGGMVLLNVAMTLVDAAGLYYVYRRRTAVRWWQAGLFAAGASLSLLVLFAFGPAFLSRIRPVQYQSFPLVRAAAYVIFVHATLCLSGGAVLLRKTARRTAVLSALGAVSLVAVALDAFWIEPTWLEVTHLRITSPKVDRMIRVAVLADLQTDQAGLYERRVLERLRAEKPDVVILAGDYVQTLYDRHDKIRKELNTLMREVGLDAPEGVFALEGNIDMGNPWPRLFEGLPVLPITATRSFDVGPIRLTCLSVGESFHPGLRVARGEPDRFHLVAGHGPNFALGRIDADLLVAGHTHGGQVQLPLLGPVTTGCLVPRDWASGATDLPGGAKLVVSRGVGMERGLAPRLRFLCRPELVIIDIVPE